jgi:hypothetical protein
MEYSSVEARSSKPDLTNLGTGLSISITEEKVFDNLGFCYEAIRAA